jgi:hypothetical protein
MLRGHGQLVVHVSDFLLWDFCLHLASTSVSIFSVWRYSSVLYLNVFAYAFAQLPVAVAQPHPNQTPPPCPLLLLFMLLTDFFLLHNTGGGGGGGKKKKKKKNF